MPDVTDATFESEVLARSDQVTVVVDLWAPWCGPCKTLTPILERVVSSAGDSVELVKVNVDENPQISASFQVQSIPAVYAVRSRQVVDGFIGALPEQAVAEFVARLAPSPSEADRLAGPVGTPPAARERAALISPDPSSARTHESRIRMKITIMNRIKSKMRD